MKEVIKKHAKHVIIILIVSILLEFALMIYYMCINKLYEHKNLSNNNPIEIDIQSCSLSQPDKWGYVYLEYDEKIEDVHNIELVMKNMDDDKYIKLIYENNSLLMLKSDE